VEELLERVKKLEEKLNELIEAYNTHVHELPDGEETDRPSILIKKLEGRKTT